MVVVFSVGIDLRYAYDMDRHLPLRIVVVSVLYRYLFRAYSRAGSYDINKVSYSTNRNPRHEQFKLRSRRLHGRLRWLTDRGRRHWQWYCYFYKVPVLITLESLMGYGAVFKAPWARIYQVVFRDIVGFVCRGWSVIIPWLLVASSPSDAKLRIWM